MGNILLLSTAAENSQIALTLLSAFFLIFGIKYSLIGSVHRRRKRGANYIALHIVLHVLLCSFMFLMYATWGTL
jgi:hypothetical protein